MTVPFPLSPVPSYYSTVDWATPTRVRNGVFYEDGTAPHFVLGKRGATAYSIRNYYGDVVSVGEISIPDLPFGANFDNGVNGASLASTDNYGVDTVPNGFVNSAHTTYSNTHAYTGSLSMACSSAGQGGIQWTMENVTDHYGRFYYYRATDTSNSTVLMSASNASIAIKAAGILRISGGSGQDGAVVATLNQWVRIEYHIVHSATVGQITVKLFNDPASSTPSETITSPASWNTGASCALVSFGQVNGTCDTACWLDGIVANDTAFPGTVDPTFLSGEILQITPTAPTDGWDNGWYRVYLTGPLTDSVFGDSYGTTNFCVIRDDAHFVPMPAPTVVGTAGSNETPDLVMKGVLGLGTSRLLISDATAPTTGTDTQAIATAEAAISATYWSDPGAPYADSERSRELWLSFVNGGYTVGQQAGVTTVVSALYPTVTRFEGPQNEPEPANQTLNATTATHMQSFQTAVHAGNAAAKAIGPSAISISNIAMWRAFGDASGFDYCDEISFHAYNFATNGDLNLGRSTLDAWTAMLADYSADTKPRWQTESTHAFTSVYGVYHPRRARVPILQILLMEQYAIPRERNSQWYDTSHGFWDYPAWLENSDGSLNPQCVLGRVLAEETWGKPYASALDFGTPGNNVFLGNVYTNAATVSTVVLMAASFIPDASVTLTVTGAAGPLTVVDGLGNSSSVALTAGKLTVSLTDIPVYVRLPAGASVDVFSCNDWADTDLTASTGLTPTSRSIGGVTALFAGSSKNVIADGGFMTNYASSTGIAYSGVGQAGSYAGDTAEIVWPSPIQVGRVLIWCGPAWQSGSGLIDFDIDTSDDGGATWVTRKTVTRDTPSSFLFGSDEHSTGCSRETYWDEQWIFDENLGDTFTCDALRLNVRATSFGGAPDQAALDTGGDQGGYRRLVIQEIGNYVESVVVPSSTGLTPVHPTALDLTPAVSTGLALVPIDPTVLT